MAIPTHINIVALNMAWVRRWKKQKFTIPNLNVVIINPNCLIVDKATVSFMSFLVIAQTAAMVMVTGPAERKVVE